MIPDRACLHIVLLLPTQLLKLCGLKRDALTKCLVINIVSPNFKNIDYFLALKNKCKIVKLLKINFRFLSSFLKSARALCLWQCLAMNSANAKYDTYHRNYINTIINLYYECSVNNNQITVQWILFISLSILIIIFFFFENDNLCF